MNFAQLLFPDFSLILIGYLICRFTALDRKVWEPIERLVYYVMFPVLLFHSIVKSSLDVSAVSALIGAGMSLCILGIVFAYSFPYWPWVGKRIDPRLHAASAQIGFRFNSFIAMALANKVAGPQGLLLISVVIGVCVPLLNVGAVWPMARQANKSFAGELIRNPLIVGTISGLAANLMGVQIPPWLDPSVSRIGQSALPLGLMAAGAGMQFGTLKSAKALTVMVLSARHLAMPVFAFGLALLFSLDTTQTTVLLLFSAVPTASSCYVLAARMGYNGAYVAGLVTLSTVLGMVSLPFALGFLATIPR